MRSTTTFKLSPWSQPPAVYPDAPQGVVFHGDHGIRRTRVASCIRREFSSGLRWYCRDRGGTGVSLCVFKTRTRRCLAVAAREQVLRATLESLGTRHEEPKGIGQPTDCVERKTDREHILDLLAGDAGSQHRAHVARIHC